ncbi:MAG: hypothetical protein HY738_22535 [Bacteroidia bacterium]|nr:hypothetical protein [Bacteroidia bacterium]
MKKIYINSSIVLLVIGISVTVSAQTTKLSPGFCDATGITFDQAIFADAIGSAIAYEFLVENYQMNFSEKITKQVNYFRLNELNVQIFYNTEYEISVRAIFTGNQGQFGQICSITTSPNISTAGSYVEGQLLVKVKDQNTETMHQREIQMNTMWKRFL